MPPENTQDARRPGRWTSRLLDHLDAQLDTGRAGSLDECKSGGDSWLSSLDATTGEPILQPRAGDAPRRVYRNIDAPGGCTLYWDQPLLVAAAALAKLTGRPDLAEAGRAYVAETFRNCRARTGLLLWGNHYYWDPIEGCVRAFVSTEPPTCVDLRREVGSLHEARPISPAWDLLWSVDADATERFVRAMGDLHLFDPAGGGFNRHADRRPSCAFLESGGILVESLAWLAERARDDADSAALTDRALRSARYSASHRREGVDLPVNNPTQDRWDGHVTTSEVGLWAGSLLRAYRRTGIEEFHEIARQATKVWLARAWDADARSYFGRLRVDDGAPDQSEPGTLYMPGEHVDCWNAMFPTHDYPLALAQTCVELHALRPEDALAEAVERLAGLLAEVPEGRTLYAESFGRAIWFLRAAAEVTGRQQYLDRAVALADAAADCLWAGRLFRTHTGEDRYDAVDGLGWLALAWIYLETGTPPNMLGLGF